MKARWFALVRWLARCAGVTTDYHVCWSIPLKDGRLATGDCVMTLAPWITVAGVERLRGRIELAHWSRDWIDGRPNIRSITALGR